MLQISDIIVKKRDGHALTPEEIQWTISRYARDELPDYQISALLMAIFYRGMTRVETSALARAMIESGDTVDLGYLDSLPVDKHSTGGVGDKVSLILAPLVAACGVPVPMMSGRGLGHSGGTLDKLEAIPNFRTRIEESEALDILNDIGFVMMGQTDSIVPADRKMYSLRDVTGTVPSIPLICGSILSKKYAEGAKALVLDVKIGDGAFLKTRTETIELAKSLVSLGNDLGMRTIAQLTAMNQPLGNAVGNWLETREAVQCLRGSGPDDVMEVTMALSAQMLVLGGKAETLAEAAECLDSALHTGKAMALFRRMTELQGGDLSVIDDLDSFVLPSFTKDIVASEDGYIGSIHGREVGWCGVMVGAGRQSKDDIIDPGAGMIFHKKTGDAVSKGESLVTIYASDVSLIDGAAPRLSDAIDIVEQPVEAPPLIDMLIDPAGWIKKC
ncbi:thymidine phosphorylase [bacterium]|nr:thymidine phosphorylase [bacterium]